MGIGRWIYIYIIYILYYIFIYYIILYIYYYIYYIILYIFIIYIYIYILLYVQNLDFLFCLESRNWIFVLWILALQFYFMYRVILMIGQGVVESTPGGVFFVCGGYFVTSCFYILMIVYFVQILLGVFYGVRLQYGEERKRIICGFWIVLMGQYSLVCESEVYFYCF